MYARIRRQFGIPVGQFEGVQEKLARTTPPSACASRSTTRWTCTPARR
ncbi:acyl-CoA dehydrogenase [Bordetella pertussis]|nr:acyl-CoA dehydrogenase [Bordetella pertussis]